MEISAWLMGLGRKMLRVLAASRASSSPALRRPNGAWRWSWATTTTARSASSTMRSTTPERSRRRWKKLGFDVFLETDRDLQPHAPGARRFSRRRQGRRRGTGVLRRARRRGRWREPPAAGRRRRLVAEGAESHRACRSRKSARRCGGLQGRADHSGCLPQRPVRRRAMARDAALSRWPGTRTSSRALAASAGPKTSLFAFSAAPGETASDGADGHSPFTTALAKYLGTDGLEIRSVLTLVQQEVYDLSRGKQLPYVESGLPTLLRRDHSATNCPNVNACCSPWPTSRRTFAPRSNRSPAMPICRLRRFMAR